MAGALAFEGGRHELFLSLLEAAPDGIRDLSVHRDAPFTGMGESVRRFGWIPAAEQAAGNRLE